MWQHNPVVRIEVHGGFLQRLLESEDRFDFLRAAFWRWRNRLGTRMKFHFAQRMGKLWAALRHRGWEPQVTLEFRSLSSDEPTLLKITFGLEILEFARSVTIPLARLEEILVQCDAEADLGLGYTTQDRLHFLVQQAAANALGFRAGALTGDSRDRLAHFTARTIGHTTRVGTSKWPCSWRFAAAARALGYTETYS